MIGLAAAILGLIGFVASLIFIGVFALLTRRRLPTAFSAISRADLAELRAVR